MKLRLENGNFGIFYKKDIHNHVDFSSNKLPTGLTCNDFVGCVVEYNGADGIKTSLIISSAAIFPDTQDYVNLYIDSLNTEVYYNRNTGAITLDIGEPEDPDDPVNPDDPGDDGDDENEGK